MLPEAEKAPQPTPVRAIVSECINGRTATGLLPPPRRAYNHRRRMRVGASASG